MFGVRITDLFIGFGGDIDWLLILHAQLTMMAIYQGRKGVEQMDVCEYTCMHLRVHVHTHTATHTHFINTLPMTHALPHIHTQQQQYQVM